jgi:cellulose synthase (UDP-forming)
MTALPIVSEEAARPEFYFDAFEQRRPQPPIPHSVARETLWQFLASLNLLFGGSYIVWRWTALNTHALWFAIPLAVAETFAFIGLALFTFNLWSVDDTPMQPAPATTADCGVSGPERPVAVDVFIATYSEDPELVRLSIRDAMALRYPYPIELNVHVLDDGRRPEMRAVAVATRTTAPTVFTARMARR